MSNMRKELSPLLWQTFIFAAILFLSSCGNGIEIKWNRSNVPISESRPELKVYIENSGSMDGYMCDGSEFKDAVYDYVSSLSSYCNSTKLNYINSVIVPYKGTIRDFIWNLTPKTFAKVEGSHANSELSKMLSDIISGMNSNSVSVFVSDCILDVPQGNADNFFRITQTDIKNSILSKVAKDKNFAVEIIQLKSKFVGNYYGTDGTTVLKGDKRPYYIWIMGDKNKITYLNTVVKISNIQHGYEHGVSCITPSEVGFDIFNEFLKTDTRQTDAGRKIKINKGNNGYTVLIKANLYPTLMDDKTILDLTSYKTINPTVKVIKAETINDKMYPHLLTLNVSNNIKSVGEMITISSNTLPQWVITSNDDPGKNIKHHISQTSGIKYIIGGVCDAYSSYEYKASIKFTITE